MLKKQNRLARISKTLEAQTFSTPFFNLKISKNAAGSKKFDFIVSKRVSKSAVLRNKTKRVMRSVIEEDLEKIAPGKDFLIISKKQLDWSQKNEVKEVLENTFKKARVLQ
jgi:ribonuclease P protein component